MRDLTDQLKAGRPLGRDEVERAATCLLDEQTPADDRADFLRALADKGETPEEIAGFVEAFLGRAVVPPLDPARIEGPLVDVCGTGGDKLALFNVSTTSMFVVAAAGATVVKHGNRGITSPSGGADVLSALGIPAEMSPGRFVHCVEQAGVGFMFAPIYHPAFKAVAPVRQQLAAEGRRTVFNLIGPLLNPLRPAHQLIGVFDESLVPVFARILARLGRRRAWVVHGRTNDGGMDELSTVGPSLVARVTDGGVDATETGDLLDATDLGLPRANLGDLTGGDPQTNATILLAILEGRDQGPKRDLVCLNAAAAICAAGLCEELPDALELARKSLDNGSARDRLERLHTACAD